MVLCECNAEDRAAVYRVQLDVQKIHKTRGGLDKLPVACLYTMAAAHGACTILQNCL